MRPCPGGGGRCPVLVESGYCEVHRRERAERKESMQPWRWVYRDRRWRASRRRIGERAGWRCQVIENGIRCPVTERRRLHGAHYPLGVRELLEAGLDPFDERHALLLCDHHHGRIDGLQRQANSLPDAPTV